MRSIIACIIFFVAGTLFAETPKRIVSLSPNATTILTDLGVRDELVGITRYCVPPKGCRPEVIGGFIDPSAETILALKPDLLIRATTQEKSFLERMRRHGIAYLLLNTESYENIKKDIELLGKTVGKENAAQQILSEWNATEKRIQKSLKDAPLKFKPRVLIRWGDVFVGKQSFMNDAIVLCGGENCVPESKRAWPVLSKEAILMTRADLLICILPKAQETLTHSPKLAAELAKSPIYSTLPAVRNGNVWSIQEGQELYPASRLYKSLLPIFEAIRKTADHDASIKKCAEGDDFLE